MGYYVSSAQYSTMALCYIDWHLLWHYDVVAGEFAQPLSGFQDGFGFPLLHDSCTTKLVVYSKGTTNEQTAKDLESGLLVCSARNIEKERRERKKKIGPFFQLCLVRMHAFAL